MIEHQYRSMDLLKRIKPEIAEHLTRCMATTLFDSYRLNCITSLQDMDDYCHVVEYLHNFGAENPDDYLDYTDMNKVWKTFKESAEWLALNDVAERYLVFRNITRNYMFDLGRGVLNIENPKYSKKAEPVITKVLYVADKLKIPDDTIWRDVQEEFTEVQKCYIPVVIDTIFEAEHGNSPSRKNLPRHIADKLTRCCAAGLFLIHGVEVMTDKSSIPYLLFSEVLKFYYHDHPEKYLNYTDLEVARQDFIEADSELAVLDLFERCELGFRLLFLLYQAHLKYFDGIDGIRKEEDTRTDEKYVPDFLELFKFFSKSTESPSDKK